MRKLLFIGHTYHKKTKSNTFILDILGKDYTITACYMDPAETFSYQELEPLSGQQFDALVVWQVMPKLSALQRFITWKTALYFPMYDHYYAHGGLYQEVWKDYQDTIIVCFSKALHKELKRNGYDARYIQYFPKPCEVTDWGDDHAMFFWQRLSILNLSTLATAMQHVGLQSLHLHKAPDPGHHIKGPSDFDEQTRKFFDSMTLSESTWFDNKQQLTEEICHNAFFMAPRHCEGIGMSFLEAMAAGRVVVAPDMPTMNEYIEDGHNGFLYQWDEQFPPSHCRQAISLPACSIREIQENARQTVVEGYQRWCRQQTELLAWAGEPASPDRQLLTRCAVLHGWQDWPLEEQPLPNRTVLDTHIVEKWPPKELSDYKPAVTVVTVVYNAIDNGRRETFLQCLDSVQQQQGVTIEHVIVDGGSTDGTVDLVQNYANPKVPIRLVSLKDNGIYYAMNRGMVLANGDYVTYLNSDDFYHNPQGLADSVDALHRTGCAYSFAPVTVIDDIHPHNPHIEPHLYIFEVFQHAVFSHQSILVSRQVMLDMHGFDLSYRSAADYDFVLRLILTGRTGCYVRSNFVSYRMTGVSSTNPQLSGRESGLIYWRLFNRYLNAGLSREEAYNLHRFWRFPSGSETLQRRMSELVTKAFVGLPEEVFEKTTHRQEVVFALRCLFSGRWHTLRDFLLVQGNSRFHQKWYYVKYHDVVKASGLPPAAHYLLSGWREGNDPSPRFSTNDYLHRYPDVRQMDICPLVHWKLKGKREGRQCY